MAENEQFDGNLARLRMRLAELLRPKLRALGWLVAALRGLPIAEIDAENEQFDGNLARLRMRQVELLKQFAWRTLVIGAAIPVLTSALVGLTTYVVLPAAPSRLNTASLVVSMVAITTVELLVLGVLLWLAVVQWFNFVKRLARVAEMEMHLSSLEKEHPELVSLKRVMELVDDEKAEVSSRRGFWASAGQNLFFLVLGFLMSYALAKLGWLR